MAAIDPLELLLLFINSNILVAATPRRGRRRNDQIYPPTSAPLPINILCLLGGPRRRNWIRFLLLLLLLSCLFLMMKSGRLLLLLIVVVRADGDRIYQVSTATNSAVKRLCLLVRCSSIFLSILLLLLLPQVKCWDIVSNWCLIIYLVLSNIFDIGRNDGLLNLLFYAQSLLLNDNLADWRLDLVTFHADKLRV